jgi:hypothetical protein
VKKEEDRKERIFFWRRAKVGDLTNPTVCSYRPAEIVRIRARFQQPLQLGPNEKKMKKSRQGKPKEKAR